MDPYERLTAINESLMGKIKGFFKRKPKEVRQFEKAVAALDQKYSDLPENQPMTVRSSKRKGVENIKNALKIPLGNKLGESTEAERIDQAGARGKRALKDAGIKFEFRPGIGSMNREDNHFMVSKEDMRRAREVLKDIPNAQIKRA